MQHQTLVLQNKEGQTQGELSLGPHCMFSIGRWELLHALTGA
ncbi:hypothetical protein RU98_GL002263 [Enterococcus caccae]|nr:hypothetical protein RU98_GL002263 [Enterococcus caccae]